MKEPDFSRPSRSDLALDSFGAVEEGDSLHAPSHQKDTLLSFPLIRSDKPGESYCTLMTGAVHTLDFSAKQRALSAVASLLSDYAKKENLTRPFRSLTVGLGNPDVTADSFGSRVVGKVLADGIRSFSLAVGTQAKTGIDTAALVSLAAAHVKADVILVVDALAAHLPERLGSVIQISNVGIRPGSGVCANASEISSSTMPCPVLSVGIPTVIRSSFDSVADLFVTPASIDRLIETASSVVGGGINTFLLESDRK